MASRHVADVMTKDVLSVEPRTPLAEVAHRMASRRVSCVIVCEEDFPVGVISERDIVEVLGKILAGADGNRLVAGDVMTSPPITIDDDATLAEASAEVVERGIRRLPVVGSDGTVVGLVTQTDLLRAQTRELEAQRDALEQLVTDRTSRLLEANERLEVLSLKDGLLGIGNRRAMSLDLDATHDRAARYKRPYSLALLDVDHFKLYNDHYGHPAGDAALRAIADCASACLRQSDAIYRYGGEEILLILPETGSEGGRDAAERVRKAVEGLGMLHEHSQHGIVTLSIGVTTAGGDRGLPESWSELLKEADEALYEAKSAGRNCVRAAPLTPPA